MLCLRQRHSMTRQVTIDVAVIVVVVAVIVVIIFDT
jgi:hypothetical protein